MSDETCRLNGAGNWCYTHDGYYPHKELDALIAAAEARGRKQGDAEGFRRGVEEAARLLEEYGSPVTNIAFVAAKIRAIAPREAKEET